MIGVPGVACRHWREPMSEASRPETQDGGSPRRGVPITTEEELRQFVRFRQYERGIIVSPQQEQLMFNLLWRQSADGHTHVVVSEEEYRRFRKFLGQSAGR